MNRLTVALLVVLSLAGVHQWSYHAGMDAGQKVEASEWRKKEGARIEAEKLAIIKADQENKAAERLKSEAISKERQEHELQKELLENRYRSLLAGRGDGLHINTARICGSSTARVQDASSSGVAQEASARLPQEIERGLYEFAKDRDQIILDFETFKQEVRIAKCFAQ